VSGVAPGSYVEELEPLVAESLDGELHQGSGMTEALMLGVHGDHLDHAERFVLVLLENAETHRYILGRGHHEGLGAIGEAAPSHIVGLGCAPVWAVQQVEYRGSENVLERHEDRLPRKERQVDDRFQVSRCQGPNVARAWGTAGLLRHAGTPFHDGEVDA